MTLAIFKEELICQAVNFSSHRNNILDVDFHGNSSVLSSVDKSAEIFECWDHKLIHLSVDRSSQKVKQILVVFHSIGIADCDDISNYLFSNFFEPKCFRNIKNTIDEIICFFICHTEFCSIAQKHCHSFMPWIPSFFPIVMKVLKSQKRRREGRPNSYRRQIVWRLQN